MTALYPNAHEQVKGRSVFILFLLHSRIKDSAAVGRPLLPLRPIFPLTCTDRLDWRRDLAPLTAKWEGMNIVIAGDAASSHA